MIRLIQWIFIFMLGVVVGSFFPGPSKQGLAKLKDLVFTRERSVEFEKQMGKPAFEKRPFSEPEKVADKPVQKETVRSAVRRQPTAQIYTVQVASFKDVKQANQMVKNLIQKEYNAYIAPVDLEKRSGWYRVCIGESSTMEQARQSYQKIKPAFKDSFIQAF